MFYFDSPGHTPWPGKWNGDGKWTGKEGWTLQPYLPHLSIDSPACLVGRGTVWMNCGTKYDLRCSKSFKNARLDLDGELLIGSVLVGHRYRDTKPGKIVVHDMVSDKPLGERIKRIKELVKGNRTFEFSAPLEPGESPLRRYQKNRHWPKTGFLVKQDSAPVKLYQDMVRSSTMLNLESHHWL